MCRGSVMAFNDWNKPFSKAEMDAMRKAAGRATRDESGVLAETFGLIRRIARKLPFAEDALALYFCARDPATETRIKLIILAALAYFVLPVDAVPDLLPLLGYADDAAVLAAAIGAVKGSITVAHRDRARETLESFD